MNQIQIPFGEPNRRVATASVGTAAYKQAIGTRGAPAVAARFRAGGKISYSANYVQIVLVHPEAQGYEGNSWDLRIHKSASGHSITADVENKRVTINAAHADPSVAEVKAIIDAQGAGIVTATSAGTTSDAIADAGLAGQFTGGKNLVPAQYRLCKVTWAAASSAQLDARVVIQQSATAPAAATATPIIVNAVSLPVAIGLRGIDRMFIRSQSGTINPVIVEEYLVEEMIDGGITVQGARL